MFKKIKSFYQHLKMNILGSTRISLSIPIGTIKYKIYECPGLWCSDSELQKITNDLNIIAKNCHGDKDIPEYGVLEGNREDMSKRLITIAYDRKTKKPIGFSAQIFLDLIDGNFHEKILHLGLIYVDKSVRGKNITYLLSVFPNLLIVLKNGFRDIWISNVTQVPAVVGLVSQNYLDVYPNIDNNAQSFYHKRLGELIIKDHNHSFGVGKDASYESEKQIIRNAYTGGSDNLKKTFAEAPKHRNEKINELCESSLDYNRGDDFLQLGRLSTFGFIRLYKGKIGSGNILTLSITFISVFCMSIFVPIVRWMIPMDSVNNNKIEESFKNIILKD